MKRSSQSGFSFVEMMVVIVIVVGVFFGIRTAGRTGMTLTMINSRGWELDAMRSVKDLLTTDLQQAGKGLPKQIAAIVPGSDASQLVILMGIMNYDPQHMLDGDALSVATQLDGAGFTFVSQPHVTVEDGSRFAPGDLVILFKEQTPNEYLNARVENISGNDLTLSRAGIAGGGFRNVVSANGATAVYAGVPSTQPNKTYVLKYKEIVYWRQTDTAISTDYRGILMRSSQPGSAQIKLMSGLNIAGDPLLRYYTINATDPSDLDTATDVTQADVVEIKMDLDHKGHFLAKKDLTVKMALPKRTNEELKIRKPSIYDGYKDARAVKFHEYPNGDVVGFVGVGDEEDGVIKDGAIVVTDWKGEPTNTRIELSDALQAQRGSDSLEFYPMSLVVSPDGQYLYAGDLNAGRIAVIHKNSGTGIFDSGSNIYFRDNDYSVITSSKEPEVSSMAIGADGMLYASCRRDGSIIRYGGFDSVTKLPINPVKVVDYEPASGWKGPYYMWDLVTGTDNNIYVTYYWSGGGPSQPNKNGKVGRLEFDNSGNLITNIDGDADGVIEPGTDALRVVADNIPFVRGIAFKDGDMYVVSRQYYNSESNTNFSTNPNPPDNAVYPVDDQGDSAGTNGYYPGNFMVDGENMEDQSKYPEGRIFRIDHEDLTAFNSSLTPINVNTTPSVLDPNADQSYIAFDSNMSHFLPDGNDWGPGGSEMSHLWLKHLEGLTLQPRLNELAVIDRANSRLFILGQINLESEAMGTFVSSPDLKDDDVVVEVFR